MAKTKTPKTFDMMKPGQRKTVLNRIATWLVEASSNAYEYDDMHRAVEERIPGSFIFGPATTGGLMEDISADYNEISNKFIVSQIYDVDAFKERVAEMDAEYRATQIGATKTLPKDLMNQLRPYLSNRRLQEMNRRYREGQFQNDESRKLAVERMTEVITYLNNNKINFSIQVDNKDPYKIVARLEEYDKMSVDIFSPQPEDIGRVNSWYNMYNFSTRNDKTAPLAYHAATVLDTLINPNVNVEFDLFKNGKAANMTRVGYNDKIFVSPMQSSIDKPDDYISMTERMNERELENLFEEEDAADLSVASDANVDEDYDAVSTMVNDGDTDDVDLKVNKLARLKARRVNDFKNADPNDKYARMIFNDLERMGFSVNGIYVNSQGVYGYACTNPKAESRAAQEQIHKGVIGGIRPETDDGLYELDNGQYFVPGLRGYINTETGNLHVKTFDTIFQERLHSVIVDQLTNPQLRNSVQAYNAMDTMYSVASYGTRIDLGVNDVDIEDSIVETLKGKLRLSNEVIESATTHNDGLIPTNSDFTNELDRFNRTANLRVIQEAWWPVVDNQLTSIGKNQGGVLYLGSLTTIDPVTGELIPGEGVTHAVAPVRELELFDYTNKFDPVDRGIMTGAQLLRNVPVVKANIALMPFGGHDTNDPFIVSKAWAEANPITTHDGEVRPLKVGDKITDMHGNKGLITLVVDPDDITVTWATGETYENGDPIYSYEMLPELIERRESGVDWSEDDEKQFTSDEFKSRNNLYERSIFRGNPNLEVVVAPFSLLSRANMGLVREMQDHYVQQLNNVALPDGSILDGLDEVSVGTINMMESDMDADYKSTYYDTESYLRGNGRSVSHQLIMGLQALGMEKTLDYIFQKQGYNREAWGKALDSFHMMGFDIDKDGTIGRIDMGMIYNQIQAGTGENYVIKPTKGVEFKDQLAAARASGAKKIFLELPQDVKLRSKVETNLLAVPTYQFDASMELAKNIINNGSGGFKESFYLNRFKTMYDTALTKPERIPTLVAQLDDQIVARDFSKHNNVIKTGVYNARMPQSSTLPMTADPNLNFDEITVGPDAFDAMGIQNENDYVMVWRDPILDGGGFVAMKIKVDPNLTGCAIHPALDEQMKADRDGDTLGIVYIDDPEVQNELKEKGTKATRMMTPLHDKDNPKAYVTQGLNLSAGLYAQGKMELMDELNSADITMDRAKEIYDIAMRNEHGFKHYGIDIRDDNVIYEKLNKIVEAGAKGSKKSIDLVTEFFYGDERNQDQIDKSVKDWEFALGAKVDKVGPAGAIQQQMVKTLRNFDVEAAMEITAGMTQAALQAKHDPVEARKIGELLRKDLPNIFDGYDRYTKRSALNSPKALRLTREQFIEQLDEVTNGELGLGQGKEMISRLADSLTNPADGMILTKKERIEYADPLDMIAYGGIGDLEHAQKHNHKIGNGKWTKQFLPPADMLSETVLARYEHQKKSPNRLKELEQGQLHTQYQARSISQETPVVEAPSSYDESVYATVDPEMLAAAAQFGVEQEDLNQYGYRDPEM